MATLPVYVDFAHRHTPTPAPAFWPAFTRDDLYGYTSGNGYVFRLADNAGNILEVAGTGRDSVRCLLLDKVLDFKRQLTVNRRALRAGDISYESWRACKRSITVNVAICESALAYGKRAE